MRALLLTLVAAFALTSCRLFEAPGQAGKVLFVGNSLTYVGNAPAVYSAIASAEGNGQASDMIVQGGATLSQRVADGSVARALSGGTYTALVLQERGGDFMCSFGPDSCVQAREALKQLAELGRSKGVKVVLLGTYQPDAMASRKLVETESQAASEANIPYVEVSEKLQRLRREHPQLTWLASDGMHPGKDLALLNGVLIYRELHGAMPRVQPLSVDAPIYGSTSGLKASVRASNAPPPRSDTPMGVQYSSAVVSALLGSLVPSGGS